MEYLKAWIWKEHARKEKGEEVDETLLKYVENLYSQLKGLLDTKLIRRTKTGNFELAEIADFQTENRILRDSLEFYANRDNWNPGHNWIGANARETLKEIRNAKIQD